MPPPLQQGQIVWATLPDPAGRNAKDRPAVITTPTAEIAEFGTVELVAITSRTGDAPAEVSVPIPWMRGGHPRTKLNRESVAICSWYFAVAVDDVRPTAGRAPLGELARILSILTALKAEPPPPPDPAT